MAAQLLDEARVEARRAGEAARVAIAGDVEALKARRDFLESDVEQLELFLTEQRNRLRESATSILEIAERVPGGLGEARAPLLSASDDDPDDVVVESEVAFGTDDGHSDDDVAHDDLVIVADIADDEAAADESSEPDDPWGDISDEPTQAMPAITTERTDRDEDDFRFSFDDDRT